MTFKARPSSFSIDLAPTRRARCRKCRKGIAFGEVRVVTHAFVRPGRGTRLVRHAACLDASFAAAVLKVYGRAEAVPVDLRVDASECARVRAALEALRG